MGKTPRDEQILFFFSFCGTYINGFKNTSVEILLMFRFASSTVTFLFLFFFFSTFIIVDVLLKAVGDTPIMKTKKWAVDRGRTVQSLSQFISRFLKLDASEQLVRIKCVCVCVLAFSFNEIKSFKKNVTCLSNRNV